MTKEAIGLLAVALILAIGWGSFSIGSALQEIARRPSEFAECSEFARQAAYERNPNSLNEADHGLATDNAAVAAMCTLAR